MPPVVNPDVIVGAAPGNATSFTVNRPVLRAGDVIYIAITLNASTGSLSAAGFTALYSDVALDANIFSLFYKTAGASEPSSYTVNSTVSERAAWFIFSVRNDGGVHAQATNATGVTATSSVNAITTTVDDCLIISIIATESVSTPWGVMSGGNINFAVSAGVSAGTVGGFYLGAPNAGTAPGASVITSTSQDWLGVRFAIAPATATAVARRELPSHRDSRALTIAVFEPLSQGDAQIANISGAISGYSHELQAFGGYTSARIRIDGRQIDLEDWYERGLGRRIVTYSPDGVVVWEGFVNTIRLSLGPLSKTIGPVLEISNRVRLVHSFISAGGQDIGLRISTDWASNALSVARYGQLERVLSTGGASVATAEQLRDQYLAENARPARSGEWTLGGQGLSMDLECVGYVRLLDTYTYNETATGFQNLSVKLAAVLDAEPNGVLSSANAQIQANTLQVPVQDATNRMAMNIVKELVALGNASFTRTVFGVYTGRQAQYRTVIEEADYLQALSDTSQVVQTPGGSIVDPWYVLPGKWLRTTDFLTGRIADSTDLRDDPRFMFIESVQFTAPYSLSLRGGKLDKISQILAQKGLSGIGG